MIPVLRHTLQLFLALLGAGVLLVPVSDHAGAAPAPLAPAASGSTVWLCRPGLDDDPCAGNLTATAVQTNGKRTVVRAQPAARAPVDCFYVYPTVSAQPGANANLDIDPQERAVAAAQAARFSQACRVYAPMYKQITRATIAGGTISPSAAVTAYSSLLSAWNDYLTHYNHGRGIVLIGHSQGASLLIALMKREIDPDPALRKRLVSAVIVGGNVTVPKGKTTGGDFAHIPACERAAQIGCVIAYSSFDMTPPADSFFGRVGTSISAVSGFGDAKKSGLEVLCTNPASLSGGTGVLQTYLPTQSARRPGATSPGSSSNTSKVVSTPWVTYPDLYQARCEKVDGANVLMVSVKDNSPDPRPIVTDSLGPRWGLHLVDVNLALGNLVSLVSQESAAWRIQASTRSD